MEHSVESITQYLSLLKVVVPDEPIKSAHWAYFLNKYSAKKFRLEAERTGYAIALSDHARSDYNQFVVVFTSSGLLTPQCFLDQVLEAKRLVEEYGGEYDGFEHSATKVGAGDDQLIPVDYQAEPDWVVRV